MSHQHRKLELLHDLPRGASEHELTPRRASICAHNEHICSGCESGRLKLRARTVTADFSPFNVGSVQPQLLNNVGVRSLGYARQGITIVPNKYDDAIGCFDEWNRSVNGYSCLPAMIPGDRDTPSGDTIIAQGRHHERRRAASNCAILCYVAAQTVQSACRLLDDDQVVTPARERQQLVGITFCNIKARVDTGLRTSFRELGPHGD